MHGSETVVEVESVETYTYFVYGNDFHRVRGLGYVSGGTRKRRKDECYWVISAIIIWGECPSLNLRVPPIHKKVPLSCQSFTVSVLGFVPETLRSRTIWNWIGGSTCLRVRGELGGRPRLGAPRSKESGRYVGDSTKVGYRLPIGTESEFTSSILLFPSPSSQLRGKDGNE